MEWWLICLGFVCVSGNVVLGESDVSNQCANGRVWLECAHCARTCENYAEVDCMAGCVDNIPGCYCPPELVLDEDTGTCVPAEQCQKCFGPNESWRNGICDRHCPGLTNQTGCPITTQCFCDDGFARNEFDICILSTSCPVPECLNGRVWSDCGACRDHTCSVRILLCPPTCVRGCFCPGGTVVDDFTGECIPVENCPNYQPGCHCTGDYVREYGGACILKSECPWMDFTTSEPIDEM